MAIKKFNDYATTKAYKDFNALPKGAYVLEIKGASVQNNSVGEYVKISFDIAEGEYSNYYTKDYESQTGEDKKWRGIYLLNIPKDDGSEKDGWAKRKFKTFVETLEESNPGYHFDWDEAGFKGRLIGGLFNIREYEKSDGSIGQATNLAQVTTVEKVRGGNYKLPNDKLLNKGSSDAGGDWMNVSEISDGELPF